MEIYAQLPEDVAALSIEELQALLDTLVGQVDGVAKGEVDTGELTAAEVLAATEQAVVGIESLRSELGEREAAAAEVEASMAALAARALGPEPVAEEPTPDPEPEPEPEPAP